MSITAESFIKKGQERLGSFQLVDSEGINPDRTVCFEKAIPENNLTIRIIGPVENPNANGQQAILVKLISHDTIMQNPVVELIHTAVRVGWEKILLDKIDVLETFIYERICQCKKCAVRLIPKQEMINESNKPNKCKMQRITLFCPNCKETNILPSHGDELIIELNKKLIREDKD